MRAIALDDRDPWGHIALGYWALMEKRTEGSDRGIPARGRASIRIRQLPIPTSDMDWVLRVRIGRRSSTLKELSG